MAAEYPCAPGAWRDAEFWNAFCRLEADHQTIQNELERARRHLDSCKIDQLAEVRQAWQSYCAAIDRLDGITDSIRELSQCRPIDLGIPDSLTT